MTQKIDIEIDDTDGFASVDPQSYREKWPQYILKLENIYMGGGGAIYNEDGSLHQEANFSYNFWKHVLSPNSTQWPQNTLESREEIEKIALNQFTIKELDEKTPYVYGHHYFNIYVFGHNWDTFQDLSKIETLNLPNKVLITPPLTTHVHDLKLQLELFGYPQESRINLDLPVGHNILYKVPLLYYPSTTAYPSQVSRGGLEYLRSKYYPLCDTYPSHTKLYLQRPKGDGRIVVNEERVVSFLKSKGFTMVDGTEGLKEHIRLFRNARVIIGMHGSLFRNQIFSDKNPRVYEFCPHNREDHNFEGIGKTMGVDYKWIKTEADDNHNIKINIDKYLRDL